MRSDGSANLLVESGRQTRRPKTEGRKKAEARNPNATRAAARPGSAACSAFGIRPSFGLRASAFGFLLPYVLLALTFGVLAGQAASSLPPAPNGWQAFSPRDELRPEFTYNPKAGPSGKGAFIIRTGKLEGLDGHWAKTFQLAGADDEGAFA